MKQVNLAHYNFTDNHREQIVLVTYTDRVMGNPVTRLLY